MESLLVCTDKKSQVLIISTLIQPMWDKGSRVQPIGLNNFNRKYYKECSLPKYHRSLIYCPLNLKLSTNTTNVWLLFAFGSCYQLTSELLYYSIYIQRKIICNCKITLNKAKFWYFSDDANVHNNVIHIHVIYTDRLKLWQKALLVRLMMYQGLYIDNSFKTKF